MEEESPYSAIKGLDQSPEASKDWSLNIDRSPITGWSPEILQSPTVSSTADSLRNSFIYGSPSMSPCASNNQSCNPFTPNRSVSAKVNPFTTTESPSMSPISKGVNPFIVGSPPTPPSPKSSSSLKVNHFTDELPSMPPISKGFNPFITGSPPTTFTPKSSVSPKVNPFTDGLPTMSPIQKNHCPPTTPFIAESLSLPNVSPTPSGYQCPPSTPTTEYPTTYITPKVELKNFKYSDLQELCKSPRFFQEWSLKL